MTILLLGLVAFITGALAFRFAWRYWISVQNRGPMYWLFSAAVPVIATFTTAVLVAGLGVLGIPFALGTALWLATIFALLYRWSEIQRQMWATLGERTIDSVYRRHHGDLPPNMSFLVKFFRLVSGDTKKAERK